MEPSKVTAANRREREAAELGQRTTVASIARVKLDALFGLYAYDIPPNEGSALGRTPILYGENGLGKTTVLKILFHLLSPAGNRNHRSALGKIKFRKAEVFLSNGVTVSANRSGEKLLGGVRVEVARVTDSNRELLGGWDWFPENDPDGEASRRFFASIDTSVVRELKVRSSKERSKALESALVAYWGKESNPREGEEAFYRALRENVPRLYFLTADRTLISDEVDPDLATGPMTDSRRAMRPEVMVAEGRQRALNLAISTASRRLSQIAVRATRQGSESMHNIYQDLIRRLASRSSSAKTSQPPTAIADLTETLLALSARYDLYAKYGIAPRLEGPALVELLGSIRPRDRSIAVHVLRPYVESLSKQANSFAQAYGVIDTFVGTVNEFLYDKTLSFAVGDGILVRNRLGDLLEPRDLSSGEQQLLLLFCHITTAQDSGGIFIIDEPEISLNVKWQRKLVDSLLKLDPAGNLQFVLASHSLELLTKHRDSVVSLHEVANG